MCTYVMFNKVSQLCVVVAILFVIVVTGCQDEIEVVEEPVVEPTEFAHTCERGTASSDPAARAGVELCVACDESYTLGEEGDKWEGRCISALYGVWSDVSETVVINFTFMEDIARRSIQIVGEDVSDIQRLMCPYYTTANEIVFERGEDCAKEMRFPYEFVQSSVAARAVSEGLSVSENGEEASDEDEEVTEYIQIDEACQGSAAECDTMIVVRAAIDDGDGTDDGAGDGASGDDGADGVDGDSGDGDDSGSDEVSYDYVCVNGTPSDGTTVAPLVENCHTCDGGYHRDGVLCVANEYSCLYGEAAEGQPAEDGEMRCAVCDSGYELIDGECAIDGDGDGVNYSDDRCPSGAQDWTSSAVTDGDGDGCHDAYEDVDDDNDGLIEIDNLDMLYNMRYNLAGARYKRSADDAGDTTGGPTTATDDCTTNRGGIYLCGYELTRDLDFNVAADYADDSPHWSSSAWRPNSSDPNSATNAGFDGIARFESIFEGNGYLINNLYTRSPWTGNTGLFRSIFSGSVVRNVRVHGHVYGAGGVDSVGILVGFASYGSVENCHTSGLVDADLRDDYAGGLIGYAQGTSNMSITSSSSDATVYGGRGNDRVGGLVGTVVNIGVIGSYATGDVSGDLILTTAPDDGNDWIGGLIGDNNYGKIVASFATGDAHNYHSLSDYSTNVVRIGGLVGYNALGTIVASYATGDVSAGAGDNGCSGGLVGTNYRGTIIASYARGDAHAGEGNNEYVGGLVGQNVSGTIASSYATGDADGGDGSTRAGGLTGGTFETGADVSNSYATGDAHGGEDMIANSVGSLAGSNSSDGTITASYSFGSVTNVNIEGHNGSALPDGVTDATDLTLSVVGSAWNSASEYSLNAWDFGADNQTPALRYADYDGSGSIIACGDFPAVIPSESTPIVCNDTLLGGQHVYTCTNGTPASGIPTERQERCGACNAGYTVDADTHTCVEDMDSDGVEDTLDIDVDNDGLIEIDNLDMLYNIRYNLEGTSYKRSTDDSGNTSGGPTSATGNCAEARNGFYLCGYELTRNLDFNNAADYAEGSSYWSSGAWRPNHSDPDIATNRGFDYIGYMGNNGRLNDSMYLDHATFGAFSALFEGNNHEIQNFYSRNTSSYSRNIGLFRSVLRGAIRNLTVTGNVYGGSGNFDYVGLVAGNAVNSRIENVVVDGNVYGEKGDSDYVGGVVGYALYSVVNDSASSGSVDGGAGEYDAAGGVIGYSYGGEIEGCSSTAIVARGGENDYTGSVVGYRLGG